MAGVEVAVPPKLLPCRPLRKRANVCMPNRIDGMRIPAPLGENVIDLGPVSLPFALEGVTIEGHWSVLPWLDMMHDPQAFTDLPDIQSPVLAQSRQRSGESTSFVAVPSRVW
eukprot:CAMPEP_0197663282 /NCGR_PEP_ID=MMETSP1338-20131121/56839_1 /TAXON_ID=43686 ORGANISM="Pelagodinium beii, Strain RCC1491" /NCGR_SAMPLE_ID=MMETSP1338 /ASSEMBLY_ACC=CAM_ASM_000754 /LENGTH=111 /DNA_ID=CAMNT_0043241571 /DNA_START=56 /DNA_END=391 /DNA_ORIENTATION=-